MNKNYHFALTNISIKEILMFPFMRTTLTHSSHALPALAHSFSTGFSNIRNDNDLTSSRIGQHQRILELKVKEKIAKDLVQEHKTIANISLIFGIGTLGTDDLMMRFKDSLSLDVLTTIEISDGLIYGGMGLCAISVVMRCSSLYQRTQANAAAKERQQFMDKINDSL